MFEEDSGSGETNVLYKFEYHLKDHLGNVRVVFGGHSNGQPEYIQRTDYYPFGLVMAQKNYTSFDELSADRAPFENKYLYNGKEWQNDEVGGVKLDWYDYGARMYDPTLGRFHTLDPKAEDFFDWTPYNYALDNPVKLIDLDGMAPSNPQDPVKQNKTTTNPSGNAIQSAIAQGRAASNIKREATRILLDKHYGGNYDNVSEGEYLDLAKRVSDRIGVSFSKGKVDVSFDGTLNTEEEKSTMSKLTDAGKEQAIGFAKDEIIDRTLDKAVAKKIITTGVKGAISTTLSVVEKVMDPLETGDSSTGPIKDLKTSGVIITGFTSQTTSEEIMRVIQTELNRLNSNQ